MPRIRSALWRLFLSAEILTNGHCFHKARQRGCSCAHKKENKMTKCCGFADIPTLSPEDIKALLEVGNYSPELHPTEEMLRGARGTVISLVDWSNKPLAEPDEELMLLAAQIIGKDSRRGMVIPSIDFCAGQKNDPEA